MSGARIRVDIGRAIDRPDDHGRTVHPVDVRYHGRNYSAEVAFAIVNDEVPFGVSECSDEAFAAICAALVHVGKPQLREQLQAARR